MSEHGQYKVVMLGSSGVGKTALVEHITSSDFSGVHIPTVGAQFVSLDFRLDTDKVTLELWDTAGQEVFRSLVGFYAREAKGAFLVADITSKTTFEELDKWVEFIKDQAPSAQIILFANKCDLEFAEEFTSDDLREYAKKHEYQYMEGSAKTGQNVEDAFTLMAELVHRAGDQTKQSKVQIEETPKKEKKGCC